MYIDKHGIRHQSIIIIENITNLQYAVLILYIYSIVVIPCCQVAIIRRCKFDIFCIQGKLKGTEAERGENQFSVRILPIFFPSSKKEVEDGQ